MQDATDSWGSMGTAQTSDICEGFEDASWCAGPSDPEGRKTIRDECELREQAGRVCADEDSREARDPCAFPWGFAPEYCATEDPTDSPATSETADPAPPPEEPADVLPVTGLPLPLLVAFAVALVALGASVLVWARR